MERGELQSHARQKGTEEIAGENPDFSMFFGGNLLRPPPAPRCRNPPAHGAREVDLFGNPWGGGPGQTMFLRIFAECQGLAALAPLYRYQHFDREFLRSALVWGKKIDYNTGIGTIQGVARARASYGRRSLYTGA